MSVAPPATPTDVTAPGPAPSADLGAFHALGARAGLSPIQKALLGTLGVVAASALFAEAPAAWFVLPASALFLMIIGVQIGAAIESAGDGPYESDGHEARGWPPYTILVPLYREARVVPQLVESLSQLRYPCDRLEIFLLLEADDTETADAIAAHGLPAHARAVVVPPGAPRTKPRALNYGLAAARGRYVTVFDAEDMPEADQLQRAVRLFEAAPGEVRCLQARLSIDNAADGWLPLMLAIEYASLFDAIKCGLARSAMPVPLGGTSNHFRRADLIALGGWDPWNVAEDADLGLRIARRGGLVLDLPSTTFEEAPISLDAWLKQRRRWFKGWMQTGITHARAPGAGVRAMGIAPWLVAQLGVVGLVASALTFPFFGAWVTWNYASGDLWEAGTPLALVTNSVAIVVVLMGGIAMVLPALMGLRRRRLWILAPWLVTLPIYLMLVSAAAWLALWDLWRRPFDWRKTEHGLGRRRQGATVRSRR